MTCTLVLALVLVACLPAAPARRQRPLLSWLQKAASPEDAFEQATKLIADEAILLACQNVKERFETVKFELSSVYNALEARISADETENLGASWAKLKEILERLHQHLRQLNLLTLHLGGHLCPNGPKLADIDQLRVLLKDDICKEKMEQFQKIRHAAAKESPSLGDNLQHLPELVQQLDWLETSLEGNRCPNGPELRDIQHLWESLREDMKHE